MISNGNQTITLDDILDYKTEIEILEFYLDIKDLPITINSPLRKDNNASFRIDYSDNGRISFYDFGGINEHGGLFDLLMRIYQLSFTDILIKIYNEMIIGKSLTKIKRDKINFTNNYKSKIEKLNVKVRKWRDYDLEFWSKYGISQQWLEFGDIYPISHIFITKKDEDMIIPCEKFAYAYVEFKDGKTTYKIYQPYSENYKWINKHDKSVIDLWSKLPSSGQNLIITSSRKDALCIWANLNIPSICLQAESYAAKENVMQQLIDRFENIYVLYDNDFNSEQNWGRIGGQKIAQMFNFKQIEIPDEYQSKDPSDLYKNHGKEKFINTISKLIQ